MGHSSQFICNELLNCQITNKKKGSFRVLLKCFTECVLWLLLLCLGIQRPSAMLYQVQPSICLLSLHLLHSTLMNLLLFLHSFEFLHSIRDISLLTSSHSLLNENICVVSTFTIYIKIIMY